VSTRSWRTAATIVLACGTCLGLAGGCAFGPNALELSHGRYYEAVRQVDEEQLLRNIVHLRYMESPDALNVTSIAAQYELSGQAEARPFFIAPNPSNSNVIFRTFTSILPDVSVTGSNRPTLTLTPADDAVAAQRILTPITADTLVFLSQTGWPVGAIMRLWMERLNGVPNATAGGGGERDAPPDFARFQRIAELCQIAQDRQLLTIRTEQGDTTVGGPLSAEAVNASSMVEAAKAGLEYRRSEDGKSWTLVRPMRELVMVVSPGAENAPEMAELEELLHLQPGRLRYEVRVVSRGSVDPRLFPIPPFTELQIQPRSTIQVYLYMAKGVEVPEEHLNCDLVRLPVGDDGQVFDSREVTRDLFEVHTCKGLKPPKEAYVAIRYRGYWYYIDDRDVATKGTFALMLQLSRLDFEQQRIDTNRAPVLTLPVGR
jgi:hypothetical protein